ncbi:MAG: N-6 DNA methylase [Prevotella sp.]|nr:N-6 DNA methylase [Prevotella sp.]
MMTKDNIKKLLAALHFQQNGDVFIKSYEGVACPLKVDVRNGHFHYKEIGVTVGRETTSNFSEPENFVVFECVDRLLSMGYKPEHIELEPAWKLGHTQKGGYADIWVRTHNSMSGDMATDKESLLIIECKRPDEFDGAWRDTLEDGAQLFSYFQQEQATKFLCLYTSDLDGKDTKPVYYLINVQDNGEKLKNNPDLSTYKDAMNNKQLFRVWHDTYQCDAATKGLFEDDIQPYHIGKNKFSVKDLVPISNDEIKKKYNEFATILRRHNVGAKENAFDKLVNLFLAKVVDETNNPNDLHFYWKGAAYDDDFSLQDRLQRLYRDGMEKFLNETVTYIENDQIEKAFRWYKKDPDATMKTVMEYFRALKFYSDNDFSFISVHNERLFKENAKILREVLQMLQNIKLKSTAEEGKETETNQFLGDLFEGFLTKGVKQSEGQYFTPMPIVRFIVSSLPLEQMVSQCERIPSCIDYACGAGHFLTEYAVRIKEFVEKYRPDIDIHEYYKHITGIEKEYRLSKVSKVSAFMYGHDETNIIYADALQPHAALRPNSYDVLVANPPYAVTGFLETLSDKDRAVFSLFSNSINTAKNNAIETFFMERSAQLVRAGGVAGIVLPVSVLNKGGIYARAREIILENFDIVSLAEFGSGTFGKTGTNTVVLFLRRKETNTPAAEHYRNRVKTWFATGDNAEDIYQDEHLLQAYCDHCGYGLDDYRTFLKDGIIGKALSDTEVFKAYHESFDSTDRNAMKGVCDAAKDIRNRFRARSKTQTFRRQVDAQKKAEKEKALYNFILSIEKEKVYIFLLTFTVSTPVLIVKSPTKTAAIKKFLGYEWSDSKGNEGIEYLHLSKSKSENDDEGDDDDTVQQIRGINGIRTPLFNPDNLYDQEKINTLIRHNFLGEDVTISEYLSEFVSQARLVDIIDFFKTSFSKGFKTSKINHKPKGKFDYTRLENILAEIEEANIKVQENEIMQSGNTPVITQEKDNLISGYVNSTNCIKNHPVIVFGDHSCTFKYVDFDFVRGADGTQLIQSNTPKIHLKYLYHFLSNSRIENAERYERHFKYLKDMWIPMADEKTQDYLIKECEAVDKETEEAKKQIFKAKEEIDNIISKVNGISKSLRVVAPFVTGRIDFGKISASDYITTDNMLQNFEGIRPYDGEPQTGNVIEYKRGDILMSNIRPYLKKLWLADRDGGCNPDVMVFRPTSDVMPEFVYYMIRNQVFIDYVMSDVKGMKMPRGNKDNIIRYSIPVPQLSIQQQIVAEIYVHDAKIAEAKAIINNSAERKQAILDKYLK